MAFFRPSDPIPPQNTAGRADLHATGLTGAVSSAVLWALQTYVWHAAVPEQVAVFVWIAVPYVLSQVTGHLVRNRREAAAGSPVTPAGPSGP